MASHGHDFFRKVKHASYAATRDALAQECQKFKPDLKTAQKTVGVEVFFKTCWVTLKLDGFGIREC